MKKWLISNKWDVLVWGVSIIFLVWALFPLLTGKVVAGWDTTAHYYLLTKMSEYLREFRITGYDSNWLAGYPTFNFYGPMPYMLMTIPYFLSGGLVSLTWSFNLFLFALPFMFLAALYFVTYVWFGRKVAPLSLIFGVISLATIKFHSYLGLGIHGMLYVGLFTSAFAIILMLTFLGIIELQRRTKKKIYLVMAALLLAMIIMTHAMSTIFTGLVFGLYTLDYFKKWWKSAVLIFSGALLLSSAWLIPFLQNLGFSSGDEIGIGGMMVSDPLLALFPMIHKFSFSALPGILILITLVYGLIVLIKNKNYFWPIAFLTTLVVLPRDYLFTLLDLPLHYYRFIAHISALGIVISAFGLSCLMDKFGATKKKLGLVSVREVLRGVFASLVIVALLTAMFNHLNLTDDPENYRHKYNFTEYPENVEASAMLDYLDTLDVRGRIAAYTSPTLEDRLGSPHFFTTLIPLRNSLPVVPGLLAESALSTQYLVPVLSKIGSSFNWGKTSLLFDYKFSEQNMSSMIKRLGMYNVEYVLTDRASASNLLASVGKRELTLMKEIGDFSLLKLKKFKPLLEGTSYKPFLFVDAGGMEFLDFSKEWFKSEKLMDYPVIYTKKALGKLAEEEKQQLDGLIVSFEPGSTISYEQFKYWQDMAMLNSGGDKIIFLNVETSFELSKEDGKNVRFIKDFDINVGLEGLEGALVGFNNGKIRHEEVVPTVKEDMRLEFEGVSGVLINYSYFPRWQSTNSEQTIYWATPSMMWVFGDGEVELEYD